MSIDELIESALDGITYSGVAVPVAHIFYSGIVKTYLRYYTYLDQDEFFADDAPQDGNNYSTIDIYSDKRDALKTLLSEIKTRLRAADFTILPAGPELYETDSKMFHLPVNISHEREA